MITILGVAPLAGGTGMTVHDSSHTKCPVAGVYFSHRADDDDGGDAEIFCRASRSLARSSARTFDAANAA